MSRIVVNSWKVTTEMCITWPDGKLDKAHDMHG